MQKYPGLEAIKQTYTRTKTEGEKVYGATACGRCNGKGGFVGWGKCFRCHGSGIGEWLRIDEQGWNARQKAQARAEQRKIKASEQRAEKAATVYAQNCAAIGQDIDALVNAESKSKGYNILRDILSKARQYPLSEKQIAAVKKIYNQEMEYAERRAAETANAQQLAAGRYEIVGKILSIKESSYGYTYNYSSFTLKMLIVREDGAKFYGSVPSNIQPKVGDVVKFSATVQPKEPGFAYFTRPTKASVTQMGEASQRLHDAMAVNADCLEASEAECVERAMVRLNKGSDAAAEWERERRSKAEAAIVAGPVRGWGVGEEAQRERAVNPPDYL